MKIIGVILAPVEATTNSVPGIVSVILVYPFMIFSIWFVSGEEFLGRIFDTMFDGSVLGFIAANLMVFGAGSVNMFFGIPLKLLGVI
jgi:hypothetical protein